MIELFVLDNIICNFDEDKCNFEISTSDPTDGYKWDRRIPKDLAANSIPGPPFDALEHENGYLMIASDYLTNPDTPQDAFTRLKTPYFKSSEHPLECIRFWFYWGVRTFSVFTVARPSFLINSAGRRGSRVFDCRPRSQGWRR